jgi:hypothetical protein
MASRALQRRRASPIDTATNCGSSPTMIRRRSAARELAVRHDDNPIDVSDMAETRWPSPYVGRRTTPRTVSVSVQGFGTAIERWRLRCANRTVR